jgi:hypothetical protein
MMCDRKQILLRSVWRWVWWVKRFLHELPLCFRHWEDVYGDFFPMHMQGFCCKDQCWVVGLQPRCNCYSQCASKATGYLLIRQRP